MITRRKALFAAGLGVLAAPLPGWGQAAPPIRQVGYLGVNSLATIEHLIGAFKQGMQALGWLEGKNVEYRLLSAAGDVNRLDALMAELVARKVDVIVVPSAPVARAAQRATKSIPIVMTSVANAVGNGFVASLARPGGNITGISNQNEDLVGKQIEVLHEVVPGARRIAILLNEGNPSHTTFWASAQPACASLGLTAVRCVASAPSQLAATIEQIAGQRMQAVVVPADPMYLGERARLQELMQVTRLPVAYGWPEHVVAGGLLSYGPDQVNNFRHAATWVDKILKGARPADLPVEQPTRFTLQINLKAADALGIMIPKAALVRADEVIR